MEDKQYHICKRNGRVFFDSLDYGDPYHRGIKELKDSILEAADNEEDIDDIVIFELTNLKVKKNISISIEEENG